MVDAGLLRTVNFVASLLVLTGLLYLLEAEIRRLSFGWQPVLLLVAALLVVGETGLRLFVTGGAHAVHALAALLLVLALYDPRASRLRREEWLALLVRDPETGLDEAAPAPLEADVLRLLARARIVLTPELVAENLDADEASPTEALERLAAGPFVERADGDKYRITPLGVRLVQDRWTTADD